MKAKNILLAILLFSLVVVMFIPFYTNMANDYGQPVASEFNQSFEKTNQIYNITENAFAAIDTDTTDITTIAATFGLGALALIRIMALTPGIINEIAVNLTAFFHLPSVVAPFVVVFFVLTILFAGYYGYMKVKMED